MKASFVMGVIILPFITTIIGYLCTGIYFNIHNNWRFFFFFFSFILVLLPTIFYWSKYFRILFFHEKEAKIKRIYIMCMERQKYSVARKIYHKYKDILLEDPKIMTIMHTLIYFKN